LTIVVEPFPGTGASFPLGVGVFPVWSRNGSLGAGAAAPRPPAPPVGCMHRAPNWSARRTPAQPATGCGGRHRNGPTGGAASGMPLNTRTLAVLPETPETSPAPMPTGSGRVANPGPPARRMAGTTKSENRVKNMPFPLRRGFATLVLRFRGRLDQPVRR
jgi:hypothetical protein